MSRNLGEGLCAEENLRQHLRWLPAQVDGCRRRTGDICRMGLAQVGGFRCRAGDICRMGLAQVAAFRRRAGDICRMGLAQLAASGKQTSGAEPRGFCRRIA